MIRPTRAAILLAAAGVAVALLPAFVSPGLWRVWVAYLASAALLAGADALLAVSPRSLRISAGAPPLLYIGDDPGELRISVAAPEAWRGALALCDLDPLFARQAEQAVSPGVPLAVPLLPVRRGDARLQALWLRWRGPLGLVQRELRHPLGLAVAVAPNVRAVRATALRFFGARQFLSGIKVERYSGDGSEFEALREYQAGLDHRAMNWKASARHRKLLSQEFRAERNHQVVLAIDTGHLMREPLAGIPRLDHAINSGLLLSYFCLRTGDRVGLFGFDEKVRCFAEPQGNVQAFPRLQRLSASLQYSSSETNFTLGLAELATRLRRRSLVVLLTEFTDTIGAELMLENVDRLSRRHLVLFVALRDAGLDELADRRPGSLADLHRAVVAQDLARERDLVLRRLRRLGVHTIDAPPSSVSVQLLNRYLEIKRRELV